MYAVVMFLRMGVVAFFLLLLKTSLFQTANQKNSNLVIRFCRLRETKRAMGNRMETNPCDKGLGKAANKLPNF